MNNIDERGQYDNGYRRQMAIYPFSTIALLTSHHLVLHEVETQ